MSSKVVKPRKAVEVVVDEPAAETAGQPPAAAAESVPATIETHPIDATPAPAAPSELDVKATECSCGVEALILSSARAVQPRRVAQALGLMPPC